MAGGLTAPCPEVFVIFKEGLDVVLRPSAQAGAKCSGLTATRVKRHELLARGLLYECWITETLPNSISRSLLSFSAMKNSRIDTAQPPLPNNLLIGSHYIGRCHQRAASWDFQVRQGVALCVIEYKHVPTHRVRRVWIYRFSVRR